MRAAAVLLAALFTCVAYGAERKPFSPHVRVGDYMGVDPTMPMDGHRRMTTPYFLPSQLGDIYKRPTRTRSLVIAIVALGGGYAEADLEVAWMASGHAPTQVPVVRWVSVGGVVNNPGADNMADFEVALDIQVAGGFLGNMTYAPLEIVVYFAPNSFNGFYLGILAAANDPATDVISVSWGALESDWPLVNVHVFDALIESARSMGVTVFAATGDSGGGQLFYPGSSAYAVGCGGTALDKFDPAHAETAWEGSGGGISAIYVPARRVPDVSAVADISTGVWVYISTLGEGQPAGWYILGGTSAAAPLWSALWGATITAAGGVRTAAGPLIGGAQSVRMFDIVSGSNGPYSAGPGRDLCTGHGSPPRTLLLEALGGGGPVPTTPVFGGSASGTMGAAAAMGTLFVLLLGMAVVL